MRQKMKGSIIVLACICAVMLLAPSCFAGLTPSSAPQKAIQKNPSKQKAEASQFWGLLFAVGEYLNAPDQNRPEMLTACDDLHSTLLSSPNYWQASQIHVVKTSQATLQQLIKELLWLRKNAKSEDYVLVFITTHGGQLVHPNTGLPWDLPPKDESDGSDEVLAMYNGFVNWYGYIYDDMLNFFLSIIKCKGLCLIVDSCYSGGFNDPAYNALDKNKFTAQSFVDGFVEDLAAPGRVVLMSCREDEVSYGTDFTDSLITGFQGWGDANIWPFSGNGDGIVSAEESFRGAKAWMDLFSDQHPTIADYFPGDFPVTYT